MAKILRPRRGSASTAKSQLTGNNKLLRGEIFFELPTAGIGKDEGKIIIGDGTTDYGSLVAFIDPAKYLHNGKISDEYIQFTETSESNNSTILKNISSGSTLKNIIAGFKNLLSNMNSLMTTMNSDLSKAKEDILYHWDQIQAKVPLTTQSKNDSGTKFDLPPFVIIRKYPVSAYTIPKNGAKWVSVSGDNGQHLVNRQYPTTTQLSDLQKYVMNNTNGEYTVVGAVAASVGMTAYGVPLKCSIVNFSGNGVRLFNSTDKDIVTPTTMTYSGNEGVGYTVQQQPPYVDLLFMRTDIEKHCY